MTELSAADAYRRLAPAVLGYLRARRVPDAEDVLGEVFLQVARDLPGFRGDDDDDLRRWVITIARHRMLDDARRRARRPATDAPPVADLAAATAWPDPPDPELVAALAALTEEQREVVALRFVADLSLDDVARMTGRPVGAVKSLQHRALEQLRKAVSRGA